MIVSRDLLQQSYSHCHDVARRRAKNFYYSFMVLPRAKRDAMCAVYAFMRYCDDIADDPEFNLNREEMLQSWRNSLEEATRGNYGNNLILPAFHDAIRRYSIPTKYFHDLIDGAVMDLSIAHYSTFEDLYDYCYKVASVVGLVCIHVFGFDSPEAKQYAEYCGIAFQLTNILRDVKEDACSGRVYLPEEDLKKFDYSVDDLINEVQDERFHKLMEFEIARARHYYNSALPLVLLVHESGRPGLCAMIQIYYSVLEKIEKDPCAVFGDSVSLSKGRKVAIAARTLVMCKFNGGQPYLPRLES